MKSVAYSPQTSQPFTQPVTQLPTEPMPLATLKFPHQTVKYTFLSKGGEWRFKTMHLKKMYVAASKFPGIR
jgi:hypothetical protein